MKKVFSVCLMLLTFSCAQVFASCWEQASKKYAVDPLLLYSIAQVESALNEKAMNLNKDGSFDIGLMQINSWWFPKLETMGLTEKKCGNRALMYMSAHGF